MGVESMSMWYGRGMLGCNQDLRRQRLQLKGHPIHTPKHKDYEAYQRDFLLPS